MKLNLFTALTVGLLVFLLLPGTVSATQTTVELNANHETVEGRLHLKYPALQNTLTVGYNGIYKEDEYRLAGAEFLLGDEILPDLSCSIGFRGVYGEVTSIPKDPNISSVGFSGKAKYTLFRDELRFPLILATQLTVSPKPLSFEDTENYWSFRSNLDINVLQNSGITVGYRYRDADLEKRGIERSYSEDSVFIGFKLTF